MIRWFINLVAASALCSLALAEEAVPPLTEIEVLRQQRHPIQAIAPVFSQLVSFSLPKGFMPAFEGVRNGRYIQASALAGESVKKWSQMITLTGTKDLATNANAIPARFANAMAGSFKRACPASYSATGLGEAKLDNHDAYIAVMSCGALMSSGAGEPYSESTLLIVIKGANDLYTIQWAERGAASKTPIAIDTAKWTERLKALLPIRLCPIVPGEPAPYPSCANRT